MMFVEDIFKSGSLRIRINQTGRFEKVKIDVKKELLSYCNKTVDLLSPYPYHDRSLLYMYTEEFIALLPRLKEEEFIESIYPFCI
ncbi:hypothetical protein SMD22_01495 (plasmid) [Brevibacillus halotolerans]|nr:hypothetical protein SMD22_01495 [Brevibacillus halotolerans]